MSRFDALLGRLAADVNPAKDLAVVLCMQAPNERETVRSLLRRMIYAALD